MKKRYLALLLVLIGGLVSSLIYFVPRSEYVAGEMRYYTLFEKHFENETDYFSSTTFKNDEYHLKKITNNIWIRSDEAEKIRRDLIELYDKLDSNQLDLYDYEICIDNLDEYEKDLLRVRSNLTVDQRHLKELRTYIINNENEIKSKLLYEVQIDIYLSISNQIDSLLIDYSDFTKQFNSNIKNAVTKIKDDLERLEKQQRLAGQKEFEESLKLSSEKSKNCNSYSQSNSKLTESKSIRTRSYDYYVNSFGKRVQSPAYYDNRPQGATAICNDGTYSFSRNSRGTCSGHGGVQTWL